MSFTHWKKHIEEHDHVIVYFGRDNLVPIRIRSGEDLPSRFGVFPHDDMIGKKYGSKMYSSTLKGYIYLLHPTPELWTLALPHRTQILYIADISFITAYLNLRPGSHVIESGTGSGSFSHSLARTIAPTGKLHTFEFHEQRASIAKLEFEEHGLGDIIELNHRDVCKDGFGLKDCIDAVFLDLPAPWEAIASAKEALKKNQISKICTFSPCIEQVSRSVIALNENGFVDITMYECLIRNFDVYPVKSITFQEAIEQAKQELDAEKQPAKRRAESVDTEDDGNKMYITQPPESIKGHTSYLTFATLLPTIEHDTQPAASAL